MTVRNFQRLVARLMAGYVAGFLVCGSAPAIRAEGPVVKLVTEAGSPDNGSRTAAPLVRLVAPVGLPMPVAVAPKAAPAPARPLGTFIQAAPAIAAVAAEGPASAEEPVVAAIPTTAKPYVSVMVPKVDREPIRVAERVPVVVDVVESPEPQAVPVPAPVPTAVPAPAAVAAPMSPPARAPVVMEARPLGPVAPPAPLAQPAPVEVPHVARALDSAPAPAPVLGPAPPPSPMPVVATQMPAVNQAITVGGQPVDCPTPEQVRCGVYCNGATCAQSEPSWLASQPIPWQVFAQGEYVGPPRIAHVPEYRLRVDDTVEFIYRLTATKVAKPYRLEVGDKVKIQSLSTAVPEQEVAIQPDGTVSLTMLGQVPAAGRTVDDLRQALDEMYVKFVKAPNMLVVPVKFNTRLDELRASVDARGGRGGQRQEVRVTPEGTVQLSGLGSVFVQGLTMNEVKREVDERYSQMVDGIDVTPVLVNRAPRYVFVLGEVRTPGRYTLEGPTTAMQAIAMAGSWNVGADLKHLVVFRRDDCWQLMATKLNLHGAVYGKRPCPSDEIWLRDSDIVLVPKSAMLATDDLINLVFTRGLYAVIPVSAQLNFSKLSTL